MRAQCLAFVAAAVIVVPTLVACDQQDQGDADGTSDSGGNSSTASAETQLDSLTWLISSRAPYSLDPIRYDDYTEDQIKSNLCEPLVRVKPNFDLVPYIAESIDNPNPTTWVYEIRRGIKFWDGSEMTAEDVVFSLNRNLDPDVASFYTTPFANVDTIRATGPVTVTVTLSEPDLTFNDWMATGASMVVSKDYVEDAGKAFGSIQGGIMCTGPYELGEWDGDSSVEIVANPEYWNPELEPMTERIKFVFAQDPSTAARGLASGEFDGGFFVPTSAIPPVQSSDAGELVIGTPEQTLMTDNIAVLNLEDGPLADQRIRQALYKTIDREGIAEVVYDGSAAPLYTVATPGFWSYEREEFEEAYDEFATGRDVEGARALVEKAGSVADEPIVLAVNAGSEGRTQIAAVLQENAEEVGLQLELRVVPAEQYGSLFFDESARGGIDALMTTSYEAVAEPAIMYTDMATPSGVINYNGYSSPEVSELLTQARGETDDAERARLVIEAQAVVMEDLPWIPMTAPLTSVFQRHGVTGAPITFTMLNSPWASAVGGE